MVETLFLLMFFLSQSFTFPLALEGIDLVLIGRTCFCTGGGGSAHLVMDTTIKVISWFF